MSKTFQMITILAALALMSWGCAARVATEPAALETAALETAVVEVDAALTIVPGGGGNSAIFVGEQEVVVVDTKWGRGAKRLRSLVEARADGRPVTVIITHDHLDHVGGNKLYPGARVLTGSSAPGDGEAQGGQEPYAGQEPVGRESYAGGEPYPAKAVADSLVLDMGNEEVLLINTGRGHSPNDLVVYFRQRKVLLTGDLVFTDRHPVLMAFGGQAHTGDWQATLEGLLARFPEDVTVVPGHGPVGDMAVVAGMRDYFAGVRSALGNRQALRELRKKYKGLRSVPGVASLGHTARVMRKEGGGGRGGREETGSVKMIDD
ncbi:MAG: MBL fold metallo-hydrolase [Fidelibacterota bacterium]|nr:MAG: MBL fold metallo-hydrolase [Candidatus Neomarinimicrobiota bacterium]